MIGGLKLFYLTVLGTDKTKITRKSPKTGKHGHEKRKSTREAKDSKPKPEKVKSQSKKNATLAGKEAQKKLGFALIALTKEAHMSLSRIAKLAIRVSSIVIQGPLSILQSLRECMDMI
ncbi:hypothetical protein Tco_1203760 [Tanacetum coccineum]